MEVLLRFMLLFSATNAVLVTADSSTSHYFGCLHESQCEKVFKGAYCCPTGTCCHFFVRDSSKFMSVCKRIRPAQTTYCQDEDKVLLNSKDLLDRRFLLEYPPNQGVVCIRGARGNRKMCFGGTNSEEAEFKAQGNEMTVLDSHLAFAARLRVVVDRSDIKDMDPWKLGEYLNFFMWKFYNFTWVPEQWRRL